MKNINQIENDLKYFTNQKKYRLALVSRSVTYDWYFILVVAIILSLVGVFFAYTTYRDVTQEINKELVTPNETKDVLSNGELEELVDSLGEKQVKLDSLLGESSEDLLKNIKGIE